MITRVEDYFGRICYYGRFVHIVLHDYARAGRFRRAGVTRQGDKAVIRRTTGIFPQPMDMRVARNCYWEAMTVSRGLVSGIFLQLVGTSTENY